MQSKRKHTDLSNTEKETEKYSPASRRPPKSAKEEKNVALNSALKKIPHQDTCKSKTSYINACWYFFGNLIKHRVFDGPFERQGISATKETLNSLEIILKTGLGDNHSKRAKGTSQEDYQKIYELWKSKLYYYYFKVLEDKELIFKALNAYLEYLSEYFRDPHTAAPPEEAAKILETLIQYMQDYLAPVVATRENLCDVLEQQCESLIKSKGNKEDLKFLAECCEALAWPLFYEYSAKAKKLAEKYERELNHESHSEPLTVLPSIVLSTVKHPAPVTLNTKIRDESKEEQKLSSDRYRLFSVSHHPLPPHESSLSTHANALQALLSSAPWDTTKASANIDKQLIESMGSCGDSLTAPEPSSLHSSDPEELSSSSHDEWDENDMLDPLNQLLDFNPAETDTQWNLFSATSNGPRR